MSNEGECLIPRMSEAQREERRAWFAQHFPDYTWKTAIEATESDPAGLAAEIVEALRADRFPRA